MKLKQRSYPHPVLGNKDDIPKYAFQASFDGVRPDKRFYSFTVDFLCSSKKLNSLIAAQQAAYVVHVECTNTVFRQSFRTAESKIEVKIAADDLNENVEVNFFICAQAKINGYHPEGSHKDYTGVSFDVKKGDILAVADGIVFRALKDYDAVKKISAIMQINRASDQTQKAMKIQFEAEKIIIVLPQEDYELYNQLKKNPTVQDALTCSIVLPTLAEAVRLVINSEQDSEGYEDFRWFDVLHATLHREKLLNEADFLFTAQMLLEYPLSRALKSAGEALEND